MAAVMVNLTAFQPRLRQKLSLTRQTDNFLLLLKQEVRPNVHKISICSPIICT
jgi:hypothetical protein